MFGVIALVVSVLVIGSALRWTQALVAGLVVSGAGFVLFRYGKVQARAPQMLVGAAMMIAPVFTHGLWWTFAVGAGLSAALWLATRMGV